MGMNSKMALPGGRAFLTLISHVKSSHVFLCQDYCV